MDQSRENDTLRTALTDACDLLEGWVLTKCPKRYRAEHMAHIAGLRSTCRPHQADGRLLVASVLVVWLSATVCKPDDARTVQIYIPGVQAGNDETTLGWYEPGELCWYTLDGYPLAEGAVTLWAERTSPPTSAEAASIGG